ncbi:MAG: hypothetical protein DRJ15_05325 [Bacteroidetes bacterium]|nr:MAG: hypothetical protein DRJ15_05325 [Bacteroidota bacterium]
MSKLSKLIKALGMIVSKPYLLNKVLDDNDAWKTRVENEFGATALPEVSLGELMAGKELSVKPFAFMEGGSLPTDLALLKLLAGSIEGCKYFEIGTWRGESVANVSEVADSCVTLNLPLKSMREMGLSEDYINQHAMFSHELNNVTHLEGNSLEYDFAALNTKYDLVFIDGDHHYESIMKDTEKVFARLLHKKSIVVWHDYAWQPGNIRHETMAAILAGIPEDLRGKVYAVRNTLCAMYHPGELNSYPASVVAKKEEAFELKLKA